MWRDPGPLPDWLGVLWCSACEYCSAMHAAVGALI